METEITVFQTVCDNMLKTMSFRDDCQAGMNTAEVMTVVLTTARLLCGSTRAAAMRTYSGRLPASSSPRSGKKIPSGRLTPESDGLPGGTIRAVSPRQI